MQQASINLTQSLHEVYEPDWHGKDDVMTIGKVSKMTLKMIHMTGQHLNASQKHDRTPERSTMLSMLLNYMML